MLWLQQAGALPRISSVPALPRAPSSTVQLQQRSASYQGPPLSPQLQPPYPPLGPDPDPPQPAQPPPGALQFDVTDADMLDALHAITGDMICNDC